MWRLAAVFACLVSVSVALAQGPDQIAFRHRTAAAAGGKNFLSSAAACYLVQNESVNDECTATETNNATEVKWDGSAVGTPIVYGYDATYDLHYAQGRGAWPGAGFGVADTANLRICNSSSTNAYDGACTFGCFVKNAGSAYYSYIIKGTKGATSAFYLGEGSPAAKIWAGIAGWGEDSTTDISNGAWHHIAATYSDAGDNQQKVYVDGALNCNGACAAEANTNVNSTAALLMSMGYVDNKFSQCGFFRSQLSAADICSWCSTGLDGTDTSRNSTICGSCTPASP